MNSFSFALSTGRSLPSFLLESYASRTIGNLQVVEPSETNTLLLSLSATNDTEVRLLKFDKDRFGDLNSNNEGYEKLIAKGQKESKKKAKEGLKQEPYFVSMWWVIRELLI